MTEQAKLFFEAKNKYADLTAEMVEAYCAQAKAVAAPIYTVTETIKGVYEIKDAAGNVSTRMKCTLEQAQAEATKRDENEAAQIEVDALLQFVYDSLKPA
jgi:hypothetical protein